MQLGAAAQPSHSFLELCRLAWLVLVLQPDGDGVHFTSVDCDIQPTDTISVCKSVISDFSGQMCRMS